MRSDAEFGGAGEDAFALGADRRRVAMAGVDDGVIGEREQCVTNRLQDRRLSEERRRWWQAQRLHGLCEAFRQECSGEELKYLSERLKTSGGIKKVQRLLTNALPQEFRVAA